MPSVNIPMPAEPVPGVQSVLNEMDPGPAVAAVDDFIEGLGRSVQQDGLPRIAGRMLALLIVYGGPFSFAELARRLRVSRGSISTNARMLRELGLIERVSMPGDRRDYYRMSDTPYARLLQGYLQRLHERINLVAELHRALPRNWRNSRQRLRGLQYFYRAALEATETLVNKYRIAR